MCITRLGDGWLSNLINRLRPAPSRPPGWHATRQTNTRPGGGRHRATGGAFEVYTLPDGRQFRMRLRP